MCPIILNDLVEVLQTATTACLEGDGSPLRELFLQRLKAVQHPEVFHLVVEAFNITPDEVRDSHIFTQCESLELMEYLATTYEISKGDAVKSFYRALRRESLVDATWLVDQFQLTKQDLFHGHNITRISQCRNLDLVKWLVEKYQITLDDLGADYIWYAAVDGDIGLVRWMASTYKFKRDDVLKAFRGACDGEDLEIVKFLVEFYQLTADEIRRENLALKICNNEVLREWLLDNYYTIN